MNSLVDFCLMYEKSIEQAIKEKREDMCCVKTGGAGTSKAYISDPTAQHALRNLSPVGTVYVPHGPRIAGVCNLTALRNPEKWLVVVRKTWEKFAVNHISNRVMILRYRKGYWDINDIARELGVSKQRVYFVLGNIHNFALDYAKDYGAYSTAKILGGGGVVIKKKT